MRKLLTFIALAIWTFGVAFAYEPPTLQCLQLNDATHLHVTWSNSADCSHFTAYDFYVNGVFSETFTPSGTYTLCNYSGRDVLVGPATNYSCYIVAHDENGGTWTSNTLQMPQLTVTVNTDSSLIYLNWESPSSGSLGGTWGSVFQIFKRRYYENEFPQLPFATVPNTVTSYTDTADVCRNEIFYRVNISNRYQIGDSLYSTCPFSTFIKSAVVIDRQQPNTPILDSVTVDEQNRVALGFHAPDSAMAGYIAYYEGNNGWEPIDTIFNTHYWIDPNGDERCYRLAVLDSCYNCSSMTTDQQCNLNIYVNQTDACNKTVSLSWSTYPNLQGGIGDYELFLSTDHGATYQSIATVTGNNYTLTGLALNTPYRVFVRVHNTSHTVTASSKRKDFILESTASEDFTYIRSVSVIDNHHIEVLTHTSGDSLPFTEIYLQRSDNGTDFSTIATLPHHAASDYTFTDASADFNRRTYFYRTCVLNSCNTEGGYSNVAHNILLQGEATTAQENVLQWNNYGSGPADVQQYQISRKMEFEPTFNEMPDIIAPSSINMYHDDVAALFSEGSKFTYFVTAYLPTDEYGFNDISLSNQVMVQQMPNTYIPNAFTPQGEVNNVFLPANTFVSGEHYNLRIYARTGELIFLSRDPNIGWDGTARGKPCPIGVYIYKLTYSRPDGTYYEKTGTVTLIR